ARATYAGREAVERAAIRRLPAGPDSFRLAGDLAYLKGQVHRGGRLRTNSLTARVRRIAGGAERGANVRIALAAPHGRVATVCATVRIQRACVERQSTRRRRRGHAASRAAHGRTTIGVDRAGIANHAANASSAPAVVAPLRAALVSVRAS